MRRTKIVATLGPATSDLAAIRALIEAGADVLRLNFSHGDLDDHRERVKVIRRAAEQADAIVAIMADLQGPKIRICKFAEGPIDLTIGDVFVLDLDCEEKAGDQQRVGVTYPDLHNDVDEGDLLMVDDGRIVLRVTGVEGRQILTEVVQGGRLSDSKGINRRGGGLSASALTEKDLADIVIAAELEVDYVAVSFPRNAQDILRARNLLREAGSDAGIIAKIERAEATLAIDEIIDASDAIMIARGDLGVEVGDAELPALQKRFIERARDRDTVVITATQMMESMINNPIPTRAEVFDVANAVIDGTDAVMLSGETAVGKYPANVVSTMAQICETAEQQRKLDGRSHRINRRFRRVDEAIAMASIYTANHFDVKVIAALTESGATALWMSRISSGISIYALSGVEKTLRRVKLYRGVYPRYFPIRDQSHERTNKNVELFLSEQRIVDDGDRILVTKGDLVGDVGGTNSLKIIEVGQVGERS